MILSLTLNSPQSPASGFEVRGQNPSPLGRPENNFLVNYRVTSGMWERHEDALQRAIEWLQSCRRAGYIHGASAIIRRAQ